MIQIPSKAIELDSEVESTFLNCPWSSFTEDGWEFIIPSLPKRTKTSSIAFHITFLSSIK